MRVISFLLVAAGFSTAAVLVPVGCSNTAAQPDGGADDASNAPTDAGSDADSGDGAAALDDFLCNDQMLAANDFRAAGQVGIYVQADAGTYFYANGCSTLSVGQLAVFQIDFAQHPLRPGQPNSPIFPLSSTVDGGAIGIIMSKPGTWGFYCAEHPTTMRGEVRVLPQ
jgi:hypothetical protein